METFPKEMLKQHQMYSLPRKLPSEENDDLHQKKMMMNLNFHNEYFKEQLQRQKTIRAELNQRIKELSRPKLTPKGYQSDRPSAVSVVPASALTYEPSERVKRLSEPRRRFTSLEEQNDTRTQRRNSVFHSHKSITHTSDQIKKRYLKGPRVVDKKRLERLSEPRRLLQEPTLPLPNANRVKRPPSDRLLILATPKKKVKYEFNSSDTLPTKVKNYVASERLLQLALPKRYTEEVLPIKPMKYPTTRVPSRTTTLATPKVYLRPPEPWNFPIFTITPKPKFLSKKRIAQLAEPKHTIIRATSEWDFLRVGVKPKKGKQVSSAHSVLKFPVTNRQLPSTPASHRKITTNEHR